MKFAVVLLVVLGLVAAGAAAMFVKSTSLLKQKDAPTLDVLVAVEDLAPRTSMDNERKASLVEVRKLTRAGLPGDYISDWSQIVDKTLKMKVVKGKPLAASDFIPKNNIDELLSPGMLAFPAPLPTRNTAVDLLYPGCIVDVFATFPLRDREKGDAVVTPLLQNIQVLAIADDTVIPPATEKERADAATTPRRRSTGNVTVTLEVSARQAAALQLAMEKGTLGLAMRNPNDKGWNPMEPMVVKEGQLTASSEALDPQTLAWVTSIQQMLNPQMMIKPAAASADPNAPKPAVTPQPTARPIEPDAVLNILKTPSEGQATPGIQAKKSTVQITVIKGQKVEEAEFERSKEPKDANEAAPTEAGG